MPNIFLNMDRAGCRALHLTANRVNLNSGAQLFSGRVRYLTNHIIRKSTQRLYNQLSNDTEVTLFTGDGIIATSRYLTVAN